MKVLNLTIKNIKCFKEINIPFEDDGQIKNWSLIAGNNGQGKTTILRSLALGLCDESGASALLAELHGGILREDGQKGFIVVTLKDENTNKKYQIETEISLKGNSESVSQKMYLLNSENETNKKKAIDTTELNNIRNKIFAIGYGSGRTITGTESYEEYAVVDSVSGLFNYKYPLQNAELGAWRIKSEKNLDKLEDCLKEILMLGDRDQIHLSASGLRIKSKWGDVSLNALSDGYQSLTTVIIDFLNWKLLHSSVSSSLKDISGIFIIDEVEQHLHPKWQRNIIKILSDRFPKIQFIGSTHTPICTLGLNDLTCKSQLIKASYTNSHSEINIFDMREDYKGYRIDQILTSSIFELTSARSKSIENKLKEYREIYLKNPKERSTKEARTLVEIENELKDLPVWETEQDKSTREKLVRLIEKDKGSKID